MELNEGLQKIERGAFFGALLHSIRFPSTVTEVGEGVFHGCNELKKVELNEGLQRVGRGEF
ncbi:hypothetical protein ACHAXR_000722, partial [Thalassiosira sp. AJA248-18]